MTSSEPAFRAKGRGFTATLRYASKRVPGGLERLREQLSPRDCAYADQLFLESGWYDAAVLCRLMGAVAALEGVTLRDYARAQALRTARRDLQGIYKPSFRSGSIGEMAERLPRGFNRYFEPMRAVAIEIGSDAARYELRLVPSDLRELAEGVTEGFCSGALELAGAQAPLFSWELPRVDEIVGGSPTRALPFRVLW